MSRLQCTCARYEDEINPLYLLKILFKHQRIIYLFVGLGVSMALASHFKV